MSYNEVDEEIFTDVRSEKISTSPDHPGDFEGGYYDEYVESEQRTAPPVRRLSSKDPGAPPPPAGRPQNDAKEGQARRRSAGEPGAPPPPAGHGQMVDVEKQANRQKSMESGAPLPPPGHGHHRNSLSGDFQGQDEEYEQQSPIQRHSSREPGAPLPPPGHGHHRNSLPGVSSSPKRRSSLDPGAPPPPPIDHTAPPAENEYTGEDEDIIADSLSSTRRSSLDPGAPPPPTRESDSSEEEEDRFYSTIDSGEAGAPPVPEYMPPVSMKMTDAPPPVPEYMPPISAKMSSPHGMSVKMDHAPPPLPSVPDNMGGSMVVTEEEAARAYVNDGPAHNHSAFHIHLFVEVLLEKGFIIHANSQDGFQWLSSGLPQIPEYNDLVCITRILEFAHREQARVDHKHLAKLEKERDSTCLCFKEMKQEEIEKFLNVECFPRYRIAYESAVLQSVGQHPASVNPMMIEERHI